MFNRLIGLAVILLLSFASLLALRDARVPLLEGALVQVFGPLQSVVGRPTNEVGRIVEGVTSISTLRGENAALRAKVDDLTQQAASVPELEREVARLRDQLGLRRAQPSFQWIEAQIVLVDPSNASSSVTINRGSRDGLQDGMTVMTAQGIVGRVIRVTPSWSKVMLITNVGSSVNATVQDTRTRGIVSGQRRPNGVGLVMRHITQGEAIETGDRVITSGLGGVFPAGIVIGQVTDVRQRDTDLFQEATIEPMVDLHRLESVLVIVNHVPIRLD
jgi:rod shape-determining protein MreC